MTNTGPQATRSSGTLAWAEQDPLAPYPGWYDTHPHAWRRHHDEQKARARCAGPDCRVAFLGDSITQGWDTRVWHEYWSPLGALNLGIGGDRTSQILWRLQDGLLGDLSGLRLAVLLIGVNHLWHDRHPDERIADGIAACVAGIREKRPAARVLLLGVLPCRPAADDPLRARVRAINAYSAARYAGNADVRFLDVGATLLEPDGSLSAVLAPDGVHLSFDGYRRLADALGPAVREMPAGDAPALAEP